MSDRAMHDHRLERLLAALDVATERLPDTSSHELHGDLEHAIMRLEVLRRRLGDRAQASPYLAFIQRLARPVAPPLQLSASA